MLKGLNRYEDYDAISVDWEKLQKGTLKEQKEERAKALRKYARLVMSIVHKYSKSSKDSWKEDATNAAFTGFSYCLNKFDPKKAKFTTYLLVTIPGYILKELTKRFIVKPNKDAMECIIKAERECLHNTAHPVDPSLNIMRIASEEMKKFQEDGIKLKATSKGRRKKFSEMTQNEQEEYLKKDFWSRHIHYLDLTEEIPDLEEEDFAPKLEYNDWLDASLEFLFICLDNLEEQFGKEASDMIYMKYLSTNDKCTFADVSRKFGYDGNYDRFTSVFKKHMKFLKDCLKTHGIDEHGGE